MSASAALRICRGGGFAGALLATVLLSGACSAGQDAAPASTATSMPGLPSQALPPTSSVIGPSPAPTSTLRISPEAAKFVADHADQLPIGGQEQACIADQVAADPSMISRAATEPIQQVLAGAISICKQKVSFADAFVVGMMQSHPDLTPDQQACLRQGYGALSPEDLDSIMATGIQPRSAAAEHGREVLGGLLRGCGQ